MLWVATALKNFFGIDNLLQLPPAYKPNRAYPGDCFGRAAFFNPLYLALISRTSPDNNFPGACIIGYLMKVNLFKNQRYIFVLTVWQ
jgi:hypothetical protein